MGNPTYPEIPPSGVEPHSTEFVFSLTAADNALSETNSILARYDNSLNEIVEGVVIEGVPIVRQLLHFTRDPEDLDLIADALKRVAKIIGGHDEIEKRVQILEFAKENPEWMKWAFADLAPSVESAVETLDIDSWKEPGEPT